MSEWEKQKIGNLISLEYGKSLTGYQGSSGKYPVYGTNGKIGYTDSFLCPTPGIIIGRKGAYRGVHYCHYPFYVIDTAFYVKPKADNIDLLFLYNYLLTQDINAMDSGSAIPSTDRYEIYDLDIALPSFPEQCAIAGILSSLDDKIDLLHRQNKTLEGIAEALWRKMFIEEADPAWKKGRLGDIASVGTGKGLKRDEYLDDGEYPVIGANGEIGRTNKYLTDEKLILTGRVGTLGEVRIYNQKIWISDNTLIVRPSENCSFYFLYFLLKGIDFENLNVGSTQPLVTQSDLKNTDITFPPDRFFHTFTQLCEPMFTKIEKNALSIRTLSQLRDTLLPKLMSGEVRVKL